MNEETKGATFGIEKRRGVIKNLNTRKENHGEEEVLAVDLKIEVKCDIDISDALLGATDGHASNFLAGLYDETGDLMYWSIGAITYACDYEDCDLKLSNKSVKGCKLSKFSIHPENQRQCKLTFRASYHPEDGDLEQLAYLLMQDINVSAFPPPDLFD